MLFDPSIGFCSSPTRHNYPRFLQATTTWRTISHGLDVAVVSYCGAHIERFDHTYLDHDFVSLDVCSTFIGGCPPGLTVHRRSLNCLGSFFQGKDVWVFHPQWPPSGSLSLQALYLSTTIEAFADIWGPVWKTTLVNQPETVARFNAGLGFIVPWSRLLDSEPTPRPDEINCHWTADEDDIPSGSTPFTDTPYQRFVIGGAAPCITTNSCCPLSAESKTYHMRSTDCLKPIGTCESSKHRDSETIQVQIGGFGIGTGYQCQYKRRSGVTWKAQLVEAWKMGPDHRRPEVLESWSGLEVSACSGNARRRRLIRILSSDTMRNYLSNCHFEWLDKKCAQAYFDALSSDNPEAFYDLYKNNKEWRKDLGRAVCLCLEKLASTGVDENGSLNTFRAAGPRQEWSAVLHPVDHTWIGFLKDTPEKGTLAISSESCLEFNAPLGLGCRTLGHKGYTVLKTCLEINPKAPRPENLTRCRRRKDEGAAEDYRWSVSRLVKGDSFSIGLDGCLMVEEPLP